MRALTRKLGRDLAAMKAQVASIALVIACGIGGFIGSLATHDSLITARADYYDDARFAHVFATARRVPDLVEAKLRAIAGVVEVETRVVRDAQLSIEGVAPPMIARLIGTRFEALPGINRITLRLGRWPAPGEARAALVNHRFFEARGLKLSAWVQVLMNGRLERFQVVGTALSPEFVYATRGGGMPDDEWFAVLWVESRELAAAHDLQGSFNSALLRLERGASAAHAVAAVDRVLDAYGGLGAVGREDQVSDRILTQEIDQQKVFGTVLPAVFLMVAAFIVNVVVHRQVNAQRSEIAALKALGYDGRRIAGHYLAFAAAIVALGLLLGVGLGAWLGVAMTRLYTDFFHFPRFHFAIAPWILASGAAAAIASACGGALLATRGILRLNAAEAMRPPAPAQFRPLLLERLGWARALTPSQRMIMRNLERRPVRAATTVAGIAGSAAILIGGIFWGDALDWFMDVHFNKVNRADVQVAFAEAVPRSVRADLLRLPGVSQAEVGRGIAVELSAAHRRYRTALTGLDEGITLQQVIDANLRRAREPGGGVVLTTRLAERLGVGPGDVVHARLLQGDRRELALRVGAAVGELAGMNAYLPLAELNALAGEGDLVSFASLRVAREEERAFLARVKEVPAAAVVLVNRTLVETFRETSARNVLFFTTILSAFAATIAVGVVYNNARIQLAERSWELASLRVLGLTRREVSVLLLGELALEIAVAIPLGLAAGYGLAALLLALMPHEVLEIPLVIFPSTYLYAAAIVLAAGVAAALVVRRRIDRLDLVGVLKTRE